MKALFNWIFALVRLRCPKCHQGKMFTYNNMYNWKKSDVMPEHCSCCGQPMEPEPGFYYGAMYMSYALYAALFVPAFLATVFFNLPYKEFLILFIVVIVVISPYIFRLSRAVYLYMFVRYDKEAAKCIPSNVKLSTKA